MIIRMMQTAPRSHDSPPATAVLPFDVTVTAVVATMYLISAQSRAAD